MINKPIFILILSFISGVCGLGYELLFSRILTNFVGDLFYVNATILICFMGGIAIASIMSWRFLRYLWLIELSIGLYAYLFTWLWTNHYGWILGHLLPNTLQNIIFLVLTILIFVSPLAFLIGLCIPLFTYWLGEYANVTEKEERFHWIYILYHLGAALCILAVEYIFLRQIGIRQTTYLIAALNIINAILLKWIPPPALNPPQLKIFSIISFPSDLFRFFLALFLISAVSGINQIILLKTLHVFWGPFHEQFAILLAMTMMGLAIGAFLMRRFNLDFRKVFILAPLLLAISYLFIPLIMELWSVTNKDITVWGRVLLKFSFAFLICGIPLSIFGATVPAIHQQLKGLPKRTGFLLGITGIGNCLGYIVTVFYLFERLNYILIFFAIVMLTFLLSFIVVSLKSREFLKARFVTFCLIPLILVFIPENSFHFSYEMYRDKNILQYYRSALRGHKSFRKYDSQISLLDLGDRETLVINGYHSISTFNKNKSSPAEMFLGIVQSVYAEERKHALMIGVGSGMTVGAAANIFEKVTAVEIDPLVIGLLPYFSEFNFALYRRPNVEIIMDDGLTYLMRDHTKYDAIMLNLPSPQYFMASKLWTKEFFDLVNAHLKPGGTYALWIDMMMEEEGLRIMFNTLKESSADCHAVILNPRYYMLICGGTKLEPTLLGAEEWPGALRDKFIEPFSSNPNLLFEALIFPENNIMKTDWGMPINTIDKPVFEFSIASNSMLKRDLKDWRLFEMIDMHLEQEAFKNRNLTPNEVRNRCQLIGQWLHSLREEAFGGPCKDIVSNFGNNQ